MVSRQSSCLEPIAHGRFVGCIYVKPTIEFITVNITIITYHLKPLKSALSVMPTPIIEFIIIKDNIN